MRLLGLIAAVVLLAGCGAAKHTTTSGHLRESDPFKQFMPHRGASTAHFGSGPNGKPLTTQEAVAVPSTDPSHLPGTPRVALSSG